MEPETNQAVVETTTESTTDAVAVHDPVADREKLEIAGRDQIHRFLGNPTGQAHDMARDLNDDELEAIKAATDRGTVKDVLARAYDRKREAHQKEAADDQDRLSTRAAATRALIANGSTDKEAAELVNTLSRGEQKIIAAISGEPEADEVILATIERAKSRVPAPTADPVSTDPDPPAK